MDFQESATLPREFRNLKNHIARHLEADGIHHKAINWTRKQEVIQKQIEGKYFKASMTCGRLAYKIIKRGRPHSDYTGYGMIEEKNSGTVGDTNHSKFFIFSEVLSSVQGC